MVLVQASGVWQCAGQLFWCLSQVPAGLSSWLLAASYCGPLCALCRLRDALPGVYAGCLAGLLPSAAGGLGLVVCFVAGMLRLPSAGIGGLAGKPGSVWPACLVRGRFCPPADGLGRGAAGAVRPWQSSSTVRAMVCACQRSAGSVGADKLGAALLGLSQYSLTFMRLDWRRVS